MSWMPRAPNSIACIGEGGGGSARTTVVRVLEQLGEAFDAGDWERFEALSSPAIVMDDRRGMSRVAR